MFRPSVLLAPTAHLFLLCLAIHIGPTLSTRDRGVQKQSEKPTSITCFQCNSEYDPRCGDPFDPYSLGKVNCSLLEPLEHLPDAKPMMCRKNVQKVYGKTRIVRGCGYVEDDNLNGKCLYRSGTHNVLVEYCSCTGDLCNTANNIQQASLLVLVVLAFVSIAASL